jgi:hypothetical protein
MWPDDYFEWAERSRGILENMVRNHLYGWYSAWIMIREYRAEVNRLAAKAVHNAFDAASERRGYRNYFENEQQFRKWIGCMAFRAALGIVLLFETAKVNALGDEHRRLLVMTYIDQLRDGDIGPLLGIMPADVAPRPGPAGLPGPLVAVPSRAMNNQRPGNGMSDSRPGRRNPGEFAGE